MRQFVFLIILFCSVNIHAQNSSGISGQLLDAEFNDNPLAFATISIKGTIQETSANLDGTYAFPDMKPGEYILVFSFVGYETQERTIKVTTNNTSVVNVKMGALKTPLKLASSENSNTEETETEATLLQTKA